MTSGSEVTSTDLPVEKRAAISRQSSGENAGHSERRRCPLTRIRQIATISFSASNLHDPGQVSLPKTRRSDLQRQAVS